MKTTVLYVDDAAEFRAAVKTGPRGDSCDLSTAESGRQALMLLERRSFGIVIADLDMPDMDGIELLSVVRERYPNVYRVLIAGNEIHRLLAQPIGIVPFQAYINKPVEHDVFRRNLGAVLQRLVEGGRGES